MRFYDVTVSSSKKFVWFRVPKAGSRTILYFLNTNTKLDCGFPDHENKDLGYNKKYDNVWDSYFKFSFVRNPFARILSAYLDKVCNKHDIQFYDKFRNMSFKEFVFEVSKHELKYKQVDSHILPQNLLIPNKESLSFLGKIENFNTDFKYVCDKLELEFDFEYKIGTGKQNSKNLNKTEHKHYTEYYDDETRKIVAEKYKKDLDLFNYTFGD